MGKRREGPPGCLFYTESLQLLPYLSDEAAGKVIKAAIEYFLCGAEPDGLEQTAERMAWDALRCSVDRSQERYRAICERNRQNRSRSRLEPGENYVLPDRYVD